jgi:hypothetical protein
VFDLVDPVWTGRRLGGTSRLAEMYSSEHSLTNALRYRLVSREDNCQSVAELSRIELQLTAEQPRENPTR